MHLAILIGGLLAPEYFLFPLGLTYMIFGLARAAVLGLMERPEPVASVEERLADPDEAGSAEAPQPPIERRAGWIDRRQQSED